MTLLPVRFSVARIVISDDSRSSFHSLLSSLRAALSFSLARVLLAPLFYSSFRLYLHSYTIRSPALYVCVYMCIYIYVYTCIYVYIYIERHRPVFPSHSTLQAFPHSFPSWSFPAFLSLNISRRTLFVGSQLRPTSSRRSTLRRTLFPFLSFLFLFFSRESRLHTGSFCFQNPMADDDEIE